MDLKIEPCAKKNQQIADEWQRLLGQNTKLTRKWLKWRKEIAGTITMKTEEMAEIWFASTTCC